MARNSLFIGALALAVVGMAGEARAQQTCASWPVTLTSGATANASDVMNDLNCAATYGLAISNQNIGVGTTLPGFKLDVVTPTAQQPNGIRVASVGDGHWVAMFPSMGAINWNPITQAGDQGIIYTNSATTNGSAGSAGFVIAPWSSTQSGIRMNGQGFVGIGTASPTSPLDVMAPNTQYSLGLVLDTPATGQQALIGANSKGATKWEFGKQNDDSFILWDAAISRLDVVVSSGGNMQLMPGGGSVGVGGYPSAGTFYVNGSTVLTQGYSTTSDGRLKKDITPITGALGLVEQLRGVRYDWRPVSERSVGKTLKLPLDTPQIGFIAQEVQAVVPEAVVAPKPGSDEVYSLKEEKLIPLLVEAIKEQQAQIAALEAKVARLEAQSASAPASK